MAEVTFVYSREFKSRLFINSHDFDHVTKLSFPLSSRSFFELTIKERDSMQQRLWQNGNDNAAAMCNVIVVVGDL